VADSPKIRSPLFYRATLGWALAGAIYLTATGRFAAYFELFRRGAPPDPRAFAESSITALIWLVAVAPFIFAAWELGRQHTAARRFGYDLFVGMGHVLQIAFGGGFSDAQVEGFARSPKDRPGMAALLGLLVAAIVPAFFLGFAPPLRTANGAVWLGTTGVLVGLMTYCHRRAMAYLRDEPSVWDFLRQFRLLNPSRYEPPGRPFVRLWVAATVALPLWWLIGGFLLVLS